MYLLQIMNVTGSPIEARKTAPIFQLLLILGIIILIIALIFFIVKILITRKNSAEYLEKEKQRKTKKTDITKVGKTLSLTAQERDLLWDICKATNCPNIEFIVRKNSKVKDVFFKAYNILKERKYFSPETLDMFFTLLYKLEMSIVQTKKVPTTRSFPVSTIIFYISQDHEQYPLSIIKNDKDFFNVEFPDFLYNSPNRPKILDKCRFIYKTQDELSYSFLSRIIRYEEYEENKIIMVISHSDQLVSQPQRHSKRELVDEPCFISPVRIDKNSVKNKNKFIFSDKNYKGKMTNISVGGCCIQTNLPVRENQHLSVSVPSYNIKEKIIGTIKKTRRLSSGNFALHIQFTHISLETKNKIHAIVYKFEL